MSVADAIAALPHYDFGAPFDTIPLQNYSGSGGVPAASMVRFSAVTAGPKITFTAVPTTPSIAACTIQGLTLKVQGLQIGTTSVTLKATDYNGLAAQTTFLVTVGVPANLVSLTHTASQTVVSFKGFPNTTYAIDASDGLPVTNWQVLNGNITSGGDGSFSFTDHPAGAFRIYRARQLSGFSRPTGSATNPRGQISPGR